jgi:serine phosphatase RsbU (regulator of sigma subunit)
MERLATNGTSARTRHPVRTGFLVVLGALIVAAVAVGLGAPASEAAQVLRVLAVLAAVPLVVWAVRWLWRKLTYRVGVRLFLSYLLIGLTPFALFAGLALILGYVLVGQYTAARVGDEMEHLSGEMAARASSAARELAQGRSERARELLQGPSVGREQALHEEWVLAEGTREWRSSGAAGLPVPNWVGESGWQGGVIHGTAAFLAAVERRGSAVAVLLLPLDLANAAAFAPGRWYEVRFVTDVKGAATETAGGRNVTIGAPSARSASEAFRINGRPVPETQVEVGWLAAEPSEGSRWQRARLIWARTGNSQRALESGEELKNTLVLVLIKLSPRGAIEDLLGPADKVGKEAKTMLLVLGAVFGSIYLVAVGFAAVMILAITRAAARLTRGERAVARGDLETRIPVKRRDQLGDLAVSFNAMTESIRTMLVQVAEKERMAREMELAREIQESLLPPSELSSGPLSVWAHFRPAAEVGGDYFDLFPLAPGRLAVSIGDVAGHGLPTGLLMAMVKSAVATLVEEGHRGGELLARLNRLLLAQNLKQRMVSFALAELDADRCEVRIASAGHQPGVLLAAEGGVEEVLLSSLPLGHRWPDPAPERTVSFGPGSRLLLYSDGLVEAHDAGGSPFGYERLQEVLLLHRAASGPQLLAALLAELDRHTAGHPLGDDLTIVLVEHRPAAG